VWPFRRKTEAAAADAPAPAPIIRRDWAALPPIQRTVGEHPLTAPSDRFSDDLATRQDPSVTSDQMGHQVSADAPAGIVLTVARTASTRSDGPAMIPRPRVQRRAEEAVAESGEWDGDEAAPAEARPTPVPAALQRTIPVERPVVTPVAALPPLTTLAPHAEPVPVIQPARRPISPAHHEIHVQREQDESSPAITPPARLTLGQTRRLGLGTPIARVPDHAVQRSTDALPAMPLRPSATQPSAPANSPKDAGLSPTEATLSPMSAPIALPTTVTPSPSMSETLRPSPTPESPTPATSPMSTPAAADHVMPQAAQGIASETSSSLRSLPLQPIIQRNVELTANASPGDRPAVNRAGDLPLATGPAVPLQRSTPTTEDSHDAEGPVAQTSAEATSNTALDGFPAPMSTPSATAARDLGAESDERNLIGATPLRLSSLATTALSLTSPQAPGTAPISGIAPLLGSRPIRALPILQRVAAPMPDDPDVSANRGVEPGGASAATSDAGARPSPIQFGAGTATNDARLPTVATPRLRDELPAARPAMMTTLARSVAPLASLQRTIAPTPMRPASLPLVSVEHPPGGTYRSSGPLAVEAAGAVGDLPLAPSIPAVLQRVSAAGATAASVAPVEPPAFFAVQRREAAPPDVSASRGPATPSTSAPEAHSDQAMDELAGKLYDRIRTRLRTELLVDRERAGLLTDLR
jgi:hypothetical protein